MKIAIVQLSGGLGNQIFQYAFGKYLTDKGFKVYFDRHTGFWRTSNINKLDEFNFKIAYSIKLISFLSFIFYKMNFKSFYFLEKEPFNFDELIQNRKNRISLFIGCWQNLKYIESFRDHLKHIIFDKNHLSIDFPKKILLDTNSVAIHVRRGDYINNKLHEIVGENYFKQSIDVIHKKLNNPVFYVFSDDIFWCKNFFKGSNFIFIDFTKSEIEDFYLIHQCAHKIISNSTFSWWPSYLSDPNTMVICPSKWINGNNSSNSLQLSNWIKI